MSRNEITLQEMFSSIIGELRESGRWGTAHIYQSAVNAFSAFTKWQPMPMRKLSPTVLKRFENFLRQRNCSWNTVSTYIKAIRSVYNRAVDKKLVRYVPRLFEHVYTGTRADRKKALEASDIGCLVRETEMSLQAGNSPNTRQKTKIFFVLMFMLRGIPFVDLAYLHKRDLQGNTLSYRRRKTGRALTVSLTPEAMQMVRMIANTVQAERSKTLAQLRLSENELSRAESVLSVLVGDSPRQVMKGGRPGGGNAALLASPPVIPARLPGDMIERRPDIWELESRLKAAFYGREAARKDRFPSLVLTGQLGQVSTQLNELLNQSSRNYELGAGILQTLFDGGRKRAVVRAVDAKCAAVQAAYEQAVLNAFREIRDALVERRKSAEVYEATLDEVNCLRRSWDIASRQYEAGYVGLMDALDTHRSLLSGELDMADAAQMRLNAVVKFCKALGGGWQRRPGSS